VGLGTHSTFRVAIANGWIRVCDVAFVIGAVEVDTVPAGGKSNVKLNAVCDSFGEAGGFTIVTTLPENCLVALDRVVLGSANS
jgi:hypothetical protein